MVRFEFFGADPLPTVRLSGGEILSLPAHHTRFSHVWDPDYQEITMATGHIRRRLRGHRLTVHLQWQVVPVGFLDGVERPGWDLLATLHDRGRFEYSKTGAAPWVWLASTEPLHWERARVFIPEGAAVRWESEDLFPSARSLEEQWQN